MLDSDSFTGIIRNNAIFLKHLDNHPGKVALSAIAIRESLRGGIASVALAEAGKASLPAALRLLTLIVNEAARFPVLEFDEEADLLCQSWPKRVLRVGANGCRIAASAIVHNAVVVTSNTQDYDKIRAHAGHFQIVDWRN